MSLKIIFMGTPELAVPILKTIHDSKHKILAVYTQSPKKKSRGQKISKTPIHIFSESEGIKVNNENTEIYFICVSDPVLFLLPAEYKRIALLNISEKNNYMKMTFFIHKCYVTIKIILDRYLTRMNKKIEN